MGLKIVQVDAFTDTPFTGNPAAICILPAAQDERWMQNVAREMNLSETAFLWRKDNGFNLRWFTPTVEVDLCGHATLASAHVLWEEGYLEPNEQACFYTHSGLLTANRKGNWIELNFPAKREEPCDEPALLAEALNVSPKYLGKNEFDYLVEVDTEEIVRTMSPNFSLLATLPTRGVIVTSIATTPGYDFISRFFAPRIGINEDPVTGAAHCCLGPFWSSRLGKNELVAYQASARGGIVHVRIDGDRVYLSGQAIIVMRGELI
jgi:PhzF family phenazine biosynthesis protein